MAVAACVLLGGGRGRQRARARAAASHISGKEEAEVRAWRAGGGVGVRRV